MPRLVFSSALMFVLALPAQAQAPAAARVRADVRAWREAREAQLIRDFAVLLAIPNVAADPAGLRRNADTLVAWFTRRGFAARVLEAPPSVPAVYAELLTPGATRTIVFYAHYDGQAVDPTQWSTPPFEPVLRTRAIALGGARIPLPTDGARVDPESRLYARSAGDDKAPIIALLAAFDAMRENGIPLSVNLKIFLEGEEEAGSANLGTMLRAHRDLLAADAWIFADGPVHQSRRQQVAFGARGVLTLGMTVYGPLRALHSGHYGNWAPNPAALLVDLLGTMRARDGTITIAGFGADVRPLTAADRAAIAAVPAVEDALLAEFGLSGAERAGSRLLERIAAPALNVDGIASGRVGALATNAIPPDATANLDFRLVPDQTPARIRTMVEAHVRRQGFTIVDAPPDSTARARATLPLVRLAWGSGYPASRTPLTAPIARAVLAVADDLLGTPVVRAPILGGSLPLFELGENLGVPYVVLPIANHDNNQHSFDENLRIQNLWDAIELFATLLARLGGAWPASP